jgi:anti-sigma-K factor RskA
LQDQCSPDEVDRLLAHVHGIDPAFADLMDRLWEKLPPSAFPASPKAGRLFAQISQRAGLPEPAVNSGGTAGRENRPAAWRWAVVAALLLIAGLVLYWLTALQK